MKRMKKNKIINQIKNFVEEFKEFDFKKPSKFENEIQDLLIYDCKIILAKQKDIYYYTEDKKLKYKFKTRDIVKNLTIFENMLISAEHINHIEFFSLNNQRISQKSIITDFDLNNIITFKKLIFRQLNYAANITKLTENPGLFRRLKVIFFNKLST